jgi:hypothetical protein
MYLKPWRCKNNHVLGIIQINGNEITRLMLYRHAVDDKAEQPAEVDLLIGPLVGSMPVRCDICDDVRLWDVSVETIAYWLTSLSSDRREQLVKMLDKLNGK